MLQNDTTRSLPSVYTIAETDILVVDDAIMNLKILMSALESVGYKVRSASSGEDALRAIELKHPDLILLDVDMPQMNGFDLCETIKSMPHLAEIPIIFISALTDFDSKVKGFEVGGVDYITKPFFLREVLSRIDTHLSLRGSLLWMDRKRAIHSEIAEFAKLLVMRNSLRQMNENLLERILRLTSCRYAWVGSMKMQTTIPDFSCIRGIAEDDNGYGQISAGFMTLRDSLAQDHKVWGSADHTPGGATLLEAPFTSYVMLPLHVQDQMVGGVIAAEPRSPLNKDDISLIMHLVNLYSLGLDRYISHQNRLRQVNLELQKEKSGRLDAEERANQAVLELEQIFQSIHSGMQVIDMEGTILRQNPAMEELTGKPKSACVDKKCWEVTPTQFCHTTKCALSDGYKESWSYSDSEVILFPSSEQARVCKLTLFPLLTDNKKVAGFVQVFHDISEQKRLEAVAHAVNTMENIGYVFSGIRHEMGNPVNTLKMTLSVLKRKLATADMTTITDYIDRSLEDIKRLEYLLTSLKSFTMYESVSIKELNLLEFLEDYARLVRADLARKNITLTFMDSLRDVAVFADPRALQQVFLNLTSNAIDALSECDNPTITLYARPDPHEAIIHIYFEDNGKGMDEKQLEGLFRPFFTNKRHGTGLGLVLVRKMLAQMDALISIKSAVGAGTQITLSFCTAASPL